MTRQRKVKNTVGFDLVLPLQGTPVSKPVKSTKSRRTTRSSLPAPKSSIKPTPLVQDVKTPATRTRRSTRRTPTLYTPDSYNGRTPRVRSSSLPIPDGAQEQLFPVSEDIAGENALGISGSSHEVSQIIKTPMIDPLLRIVKDKDLPKQVKKRKSGETNVGNRRKRQKTDQKPRTSGVGNVNEKQIVNQDALAEAELALQRGTINPKDLIADSTSVGNHAAFDVDDYLEGLSTVEELDSLLENDVDEQVSGETSIPTFDISRQMVESIPPEAKSPVDVPVEDEAAGASEEIHQELELTVVQNADIKEKRRKKRKSIGQQRPRKVPKDVKSKIKHSPMIASLPNQQLARSLAGSPKPPPSREPSPSEGSEPFPTTLEDSVVEVQSEQKPKPKSNSGLNAKSQSTKVPITIYRPASPFNASRFPPPSRSPSSSMVSSNPTSPQHRLEPFSSQHDQQHKRKNISAATSKITTKSKAATTITPIDVLHQISHEIISTHTTNSRLSHSARTTISLYGDELSKRLQALNVAWTRNVDLNRRVKQARAEQREVKKRLGDIRKERTKLVEEIGGKRVEGRKLELGRLIDGIQDVVGAKWRDEGMVW